VTIRRDILTAIRDELADISQANGYLTDVANVYTHARTWNEALMSNRPALCVAFTDDNTTNNYPSSVVRSEMEITILGHVSSDSEDNRITAVENLVQDTRKAVMQDPTHNVAGCITTRIVQTATDLADLAGQESMVMVIAVAYEYNSTTGLAA